MQALSEDLRERIVRFIEAGGTRREAARRFNVSPSSAVRFAAQWRAERSLKARPQGGDRRRKLAPHRALILARVEARPDITMPELAAALADEIGLAVAPASLSRFLCRAGFSYKKTLLASEQERADVREARLVWRCYRQPAMRKALGRLVFIDETSVKTNMCRRRGRSPRGTRLRGDAPFGRWHTQTFIAGLRVDGLTAPWIIDGAMDGRAFETYIETQLAPTLSPGDVVILDNLAAHRGQKAAQALAERGAWFLFLPRYSPDLNPIEMAFSKLKAHLRKGAHRSIDALWRAVGNICDLYSSQECSNYFKAAGYKPI